MKESLSTSGDVLNSLFAGVRMNHTRACLLLAALLGCSQAGGPTGMREVFGKAFVLQIPAHWAARQAATNDSKGDHLYISDAHAIPIDKYFKPGERPGMISMSIKLPGPFAGEFPAPLGAKGSGEAMVLPSGLNAREWVKDPAVLDFFRTLLGPLLSRP